MKCTSIVRGYLTIGGALFYFLKEQTKTVRQYVTENEGRKIITSSILMLD